MNIEILNNEKHEVEMKIDNATVAEVLRVYLYGAGADFAAWRQEHPSKPLLFKIQSKDGSVKKAVSEAVSAINKDCNAILNAVKK